MLLLALLLQASSTAAIQDAMAGESNVKLSVASARELERINYTIQASLGATQDHACIEIA